MKPQEQLFQAIGEADEVLLARSEMQQRQASHWRAWAAAAACLVLVLTGAFFLDRHGSVPVQGDPVGPVGGQPAGEEDSSGSEDPSGAEDPPDAPPTVVYKPVYTFTPEQEAVGQFHYLSLNDETAAGAFVIFMNEEMYTGYEEGESYIIAPKLALPAELPPCRMEITFLDTEETLDTAAEQLGETLAQQYTDVSPVEAAGEAGAWRSIFASGGNSWDSVQRDVWLVPGQSGGIYLITSTYFLEAAEGHGVRFRDMAGTFLQIPADQAANQPWLGELQAAAGCLQGMYFSGDTAGAEAYLAENAQIETCGEDASHISIAGITYTVDDSLAPASAVVSVKWRPDVEMDFSLLTMELTWDGTRWLAQRVGPG